MITTVPQPCLFPCKSHHLSVFQTIEPYGQIIRPCSPSEHQTNLQKGRFSGKASSFARRRKMWPNKKSRKREHTYEAKRPRAAAITSLKLPNLPRQRTIYRMVMMSSDLSSKTNMEEQSLRRHLSIAVLWIKRPITILCMELLYVRLEISLGRLND